MPRDCAVCSGTFEPKSTRHKFCSATCKGKWKYVSNTVTTESQYELISGNWVRYTSRLLYCAGRKRDGLKRTDILEKLEEQNYKCALSGIPLTCELRVGVKCPTNASIDRIEAGGPYTKDNIQMVCTSLNKWRSDTSITDFVDMCRAVVNHFDGTDKEI